MALLAHAFGLLVRRPFAWGFALGFLGLNAIGDLGWGGLALHPVFHPGAPDGAGAIGWAAFVMLLALLILQGMVCGLMAMLLYRGRHRLARPVDGAARAGGVLGAVVLVAVCAVVWKLFP